MVDLCLLYGHSGVSELGFVGKMLKRAVIVGGLLLGLWYLLPPLGEHAACRELDFDYLSSSVIQLSDIAASCQSGDISQLYYHRAYYVDMFYEGENAEYSSLNYHWHSHRMFMELVEVFAGELYRDDEARAEFLNAEYERMVLAAELNLRRYR